MRIVTYPNARTFLNSHQTFLEYHEAANNLILGLSMASKEEDDGSAVIFMAVLNGASPLLVGMQTPSRPMIIHGTKQVAGDVAGLLAGRFFNGTNRIPGFQGEKELSKTFGNAVAARLGGTATFGMHTNIYELKKVRPINLATGKIRRARLREKDLVSEWQTAFDRELFDREMAPEAAHRKAHQRIRKGEVFLWEDAGRVVAMACAARRTRHYTAINSVYTPPPCRKRGYASAIVTKLSQLILDSGTRYCTLFADYDNEATNRMYRLIGYEPVTEFLEVMVHRPPEKE